MMNKYQTTLYNELMSLVEASESFYYADKVIDGKWFRVFNYRLCSYTEFCAPSALECRGTTYEITGEGSLAEPLRLASILFPKFFNHNENPFTANLDLSTVVEIAHKMDGSLISTYTYAENDVRLKTKGSLESNQAIDALRLLGGDRNLMQEIVLAERLGYTVLMEFCSPTNRIVVNYDKPSLTVLAIRSRMDGSFLYYDDIDTEIFPTILSNWTTIEQINNPAEFIPTVLDMEGIEGFVCRLSSGLVFKLKCTTYVALHHSKDSINSQRRLFEVVLNESSDDLQSLFHDDPVAIKTIKDMEETVEKLYNHLVDIVERFYERNKELERKQYAILGQEELKRYEFGLAMSRYLGKNVNYKEFMKQNRKAFGFTNNTK